MPSYLDLSKLKSDAELAAVELYKDYPASLLQVGLACCIIIMLVGIPGNLITIIALWTSKKFKNTTAIFIINLHIINLIFCCTIVPTIAAIFSEKHWIFGKTMCRLQAFFKYALIASANLAVVAITVHRYIMVCHPQIYSRYYSRKILIISLISTWACGFLFFLPSVFEVWGQFGLDTRQGDCTMIPDRNDVCPKIFFACFAFVGPYLIIVVCYGRIWWTVRKARKNRKKHRVKAVQSGMSAIASDPTAVTNGTLCQKATATENTDTSSAASTPIDRESSTFNFFKKSFRLPIKVNGPRIPSKKDKKLSTMILAVLASFITCHLPLMLTRIIYKNYKSDPTANILAQLLEYCSAFISPIIYVFMSREYRQAYRNLFEDLKSCIKNRSKQEEPI